MIELSENRLFQIIYYLLDKKQVSAAELAEQFEVSVRTIYRDIDALSSAGIPVCTTAGRGGGISLLDGFVLDRALLSSQEMQDIILGIQSLSSVQYPDTEAVLTKLKSSFQTADADWIEIDFSRWGSFPGKEKQTFRLIKKSILDKFLICFKYYTSSGGVTSRTCQPLKLIYKDKAWYLHAYCLVRNDYRLFRISRIRELELTDTHFIPHEDEKLPVPVPLTILRDFGPPVDMEFTFSEEVGSRLYDTFDDSAICITENGFLVKTVLPLNQWLYDFILSFGDRITILKPQSLKKEITRRLESALQHYKEV